MNIRIKAFTCIVAAACWASCKKNNDAPTVQLTTSLNVVNASNNVINFYQNGTRINNTSSYYPGGSLGYVTVKAGLQNFQVKLASPSTPNILFSKPITLDTGKVYSLYISGQTLESVFFAEDVLKADADGNALVRFVNASPDAGPLMLAFEGGSLPDHVLDTVKFSNVAYKATDVAFIKVKGGFVHNVAVYQASSPSSPKRDTTIVLNAGQIYTLVSYGTVGSNGNQGLSTRLIINQ
ncbi:protein of unknown function [Mucilaginibacter sp. OK268]|jgi:hypothetical protein|uniref:DUF4397 domain-containing protein n=1 Tax=Mucilaginibacter sp. OK268 TaxID=1881048 RepID=UPI00088E8F04|nr:DUF4397 domain-containing protein [Mucilaginibacter sp. OK268]SDQ00185.1 protein of unknown function [Mucilaginibacter sp. OK268]